MKHPGGGYQTDLFRDPPEGVLVNNRFILRQKIGKGSFGCVFKGNRNLVNDSSKGLSNKLRYCSQNGINNTLQYCNIGNEISQDTSSNIRSESIKIIIRWRYRIFIFYITLVGIPKLYWFG